MEAFHYTCYLPLGGRLFELDGLKPHPIDHGPLRSLETWHDEALRVVSTRISSATGGEQWHDIRYNLLAVVPCRVEQHQKRLARLSDDLAALRGVLGDAAAKLCLSSAELDRLRREAKLEKPAANEPDASMSKDSVQVKSEPVESADERFPPSSSETASDNAAACNKDTPADAEASVCDETIAVSESKHSPDGTATAGDAEPRCRRNSGSGDAPRFADKSTEETANSPSAVVGEVDRPKTASDLGKADDHMGASDVTAADVGEARDDASGDGAKQSPKVESRYATATSETSANAEDTAASSDLVGKSPDAQPAPDETERSSDRCVAGTGDETKPETTVSVLEELERWLVGRDLAAAAQDPVIDVERSPRAPPPAPKLSSVWDVVSIVTRLEAEIVKCRTSLDEEIEKRRKYKIDDARRTHDYVPFVSLFLAMLDERGLMGPLLDQNLPSRKRSAVQLPRAISRKRVVERRKRRKK